MGKLAGVGSRRILSVQAYKVPTHSTCTYFIAHEAELGRFGGGDVHIHRRTVLALEVSPSWLSPSWPYYDSC